ncbi:MAG: hypothetical protein PUB35_03405 [Campylobacteraceae bacterium]|nr:hypothetical protein [Campylobacteraceae bacterium]
MRATSQGACTAGVLQYLASLPLGGILNGNVYIQVIKNCSKKKELEPLILKHTGLGTCIETAYDGRLWSSLQNKCG